MSFTLIIIVQFIITYVYPNIDTHSTHSKIKMNSTRINFYDGNIKHAQANVVFPPFQIISKKIFLHLLRKLKHHSFLCHLWNKFHRKM